MTGGAGRAAAAAPGPPPRVVAALSRCRPPVCAYVYDTSALRERATALRAALPGVELLYAVKANGHPAVVRTLAECLDGLEVASGGELALARAAVDPGRRPPQRVVFGGPAKTDAELRAAVDAGALVHVESAHELRRLAMVAGGARAGVALRVNRAGVALAGSHRMSGVATPFGVDEAELGAVVALARALPQIDLLGFHLHAVSNNLDAAAHARFVGGALRWAVAAAGRHGVRLRYVNVGGGLGVDPVGTHAFDLAVLTRGVARVLSELPDGVQLVLEPGRFLAAEAGWYATEVLDLKHTHGRWFAVLRGGTHHFRLPAAWGYSHPFVVLPVDRWDYPFDRPAVRDVAVDAVGELCTPRDVLTRGQVVDRLRIGDVLVFGRAGAYGWDISHHEFLRHPHPTMLVV
jgi:2-[(L-alanin-3-ylcarbamoyl)methyl]-2-hydroxybutanedioate decarboxylase